MYCSMGSWIMLDIIQWARGGGLGAGLGILNNSSCVESGEGARLFSRAVKTHKHKPAFRP